MSRVNAGNDILMGGLVTVSPRDITANPGFSSTAINEWNAADACLTGVELRGERALGCAVFYSLNVGWTTMQTRARR